MKAAQHARPGAVRFIVPSAPALRRAPPMGPEWAHEVKWDGWRLQVWKEGDEVRLLTRNRRDVAAQFPDVAAAIKALPSRSLVLDGELVAFDAKNRPDFHELRRRRPNAVGMMFDALFIGDEDLRALPWTARRRRLERALRPSRGGVLLLSEIWDDGPGLLRAVAKQGLEGIVSKHRNAPYRSGRTDAWVKVKGRTGRKPTADGSGASRSVKSARFFPWQHTPFRRPALASYRPQMCLRSMLRAAC